MTGQQRVCTNIKALAGQNNEELLKCWPDNITYAGGLKCMQDVDVMSVTTASAALLLTCVILIIEHKQKISFHGG